MSRLRSHRRRPSPAPTPARADLRPDGTDAPAPALVVVPARTGLLGPHLRARPGVPVTFDSAARAAAIAVARRVGWNPGAMAAAACVHPQTIRDYHRTNAQNFRDACEVAIGEYLCELEEAATTRAIEGVVEIRQGKDGKPYEVTKYDTPLLIHLLKANGRAKHGDKVEVEAQEAPNKTIAPALRLLPEADKDQLRALVLRALDAARREKQPADPTAGDGDVGPESSENT